MFDKSLACALVRECVRKPLNQLGVHVCAMIQHQHALGKLYEWYVGLPTTVHSKDIRVAMSLSVGCKCESEPRHTEEALNTHSHSHTRNWIQVHTRGYRHIEILFVSEIPRQRIYNYHLQISYALLCFLFINFHPREFN